MEIDRISPSMSVDKANTMPSWSELERNLVQRILDEVKLGGEWKQEVAKLRVLNRHWCHCVDQGITTIHPNANKSLVKADLNSLLKFRNLESVDIWPFIVSDNSADRDSTSSKSRWWKKLSLFEKRERVEKIFVVLSRLPRLSRIIINSKIVVGRRNRSPLVLIKGFSVFAYEDEVNSTGSYAYTFLTRLK